MHKETKMQLKLDRAIRQVENNTFAPLGLAAFLRTVEARLEQLERAILKMDSALETNPFTGKYTVAAILRVLLENRT